MVRMYFNKKCIASREAKTMIQRRKTKFSCVLTLLIRENMKNTHDDHTL